MPLKKEEKRTWSRVLDLDGDAITRKSCKEGCPGWSGLWIIDKRALEGSGIHF